jgi:hypothetical protein
MLSLFLAFLRIRTLIILGILYFFLSIASHGNFSLKIPDLKTLNFSNILASINSIKDQVLGGNSKTKKASDTANEGGYVSKFDDMKDQVLGGNSKTKKDSGTDKTGGVINQLGDIKNSAAQLKKEVEDVIGNNK